MFAYEVIFILPLEGCLYHMNITLSSNIVKCDTDPKGWATGERGLEETVSYEKTSSYWFFKRGLVPIETASS